MYNLVQKIMYLISYCWNIKRLVRTRIATVLSMIFPQVVCPDLQSILVLEVRESRNCTILTQSQTNILSELIANTHSSARSLWYSKKLSWISTIIINICTPTITIIIIIIIIIITIIIITINMLFVSLCLQGGWRWVLSAPLLTSVFQHSRVQTELIYRSSLSVPGLDQVKVPRRFQVNSRTNLWYFLRTLFTV